VTKGLGHTGAYKQSSSKGMLAHTVLMVDAETDRTIGLCDRESDMFEYIDYKKQ